MRGLAAEHLKFSPDIVFSYLAWIIFYKQGMYPSNWKKVSWYPGLKEGQGPITSY